MSDSSVWKIEITGSDIDTPITMSFEQKLLLGRHDESGELNTDLDFSAYGGASKGVSRQHARLVAHKGKLVIQDLNASNGTMLNGDKLNPRQSYPVKLDEDNSLSLGALKLRLRVLEQPAQAEGEDVSTAPLEDVDGTEVKRPEELGSAQADDTPAENDLAADASSTTVLIIEDSATNADMFAMCVQKLGLRSTIARNASRALRYLKEEAPIAVIVDYMLPGMDGSQITAHIRRESHMETTAIIMVSANANAGTRRAALDAGADEFLAKPIAPEDMIRVLNQAIERRQAGDGLLRTRELKDKKGTKTLAETDILSEDTSISPETVAVLVSGAVERPFTVTVKKPVSFGRGNYGKPTTHVDLSRYGAGDKGVSRMHMRLSHNDGDFYVEDLDSVNGTYVNGVRLRGSEKKQIESGTELRLGQLGMYIYFGTGEPAKGSSATRQLNRDDVLNPTNGHKQP